MNLRWMIIALIIVGAYAFMRWTRPTPPPPPPVLTVKEEKPPVAALSTTNLRKVRESARDSDPSVRWAAIELLYNMHDPEAIKILEETLMIDSEPSVRKNAIDLLSRNSKTTRAQDLIVALKDPEKDIRIAALIALGELGDSRVTPLVTPLLNDAEPDVRLQALHTINRFQEQKREQYKKLAEELRREYQRSIHESEPSAPLLPLGPSSAN